MSNVCQHLASKLIRYGSVHARPVMMMSLSSLKTDNLFTRKSSTMAKLGVVREEEGDLFRAPRSTSLAHCVSSDMRMGAGIAVFFRNKFGRVEDLKSQRKSVGEVAYLKDGPRYIFYLVSKKWFYDKPTDLTLQSCLLEMKDMCRELGVKKLAMPRIGCGLDGLKWPMVFQMVKEVFSDCDIEVTIYSIPDKKPKSLTPSFSRSQEKFRNYFDLKRPHSLPLSEMTSKRKLHSDSEEEFDTPKKRMKISLNLQARGLGVAESDIRPSTIFARNKDRSRSTEYNNIDSSTRGNSYAAIKDGHQSSSSQHGKSEFLVYDKRSKTEIPFLSDNEEGRTKASDGENYHSKTDEEGSPHQKSRPMIKKRTPSKYCEEIEKNSQGRGKLLFSVSNIKSNGKSRESAEENIFNSSNTWKKDFSFGDDEDNNGQRLKAESESGSEDDHQPPQRKRKNSSGQRGETSKPLHKSHEQQQLSDDASNDDRESPVPSKRKESKSQDTFESKERKSHDARKSKERKSRDRSKSKERKSQDRSKSKERKSRKSSKRRSGDSSRSKERKSRDTSRSKEKKSRDSSRSKEKKSRDSSRSKERKSLTQESCGSEERKPRETCWSNEDSRKSKSRGLGKSEVRDTSRSDEEESGDMYESDEAAENFSRLTKSLKLSRKFEEDSDDVLEKSDFPRRQLKNNLRERLGAFVSERSFTSETNSADKIIKHQPYPSLNICKNVKRKTLNASPIGTMYCDRETTSVKARLSLGKRT